MLILRAIVLSLLCAAAWPVLAQQPQLELKDGDRVVLLGSTLIERDQKYGYLETALTSRWPDRDITFRNLGWSGDTVFGDARAGFDSPADGFRRIKELVTAEKPTVVLVAYGTNESFAGEEGLPTFVQGMKTLLDTLQPTGAKFVLVAPPRMENLGAPLPDPAEQNQNLALYRDAIRQIAVERKMPLVDLYAALTADASSNHPPLTDNGLHLTRSGYYRAAAAVERELSLPQREWKLMIDASADKIDAAGVKVDELKTSSDGISFRATDDVLPRPVPSDEALQSMAARTLQITGLADGQYQLTIDGQPVGNPSSAGQWSEGVRISSGPQYDQVEKLRQTINAKNTLYFYRWRPQNETYLLGFRKHEQGRNAVEIAQFDPLVADKESEIAKLREPGRHHYEIQRQSEDR